MARGFDVVGRGGRVFLYGSHLNVVIKKSEGAGVRLDEKRLSPRSAN